MPGSAVHPSEQDIPLPIPAIPVYMHAPTPPATADLHTSETPVTALRVSGRGFAMSRVLCEAGGPLLAALASGDAAVEFEKQSGDEIVARVLRVLKTIFAPQGVTVPQPVQVHPVRMPPIPPTLQAMLQIWRAVHRL